MSRERTAAKPTSLRRYAKALPSSRWTRSSKVRKAQRSKLRKLQGIHTEISFPQTKNTRQSEETKPR
jgi:hypothetical protein